MEKIINSNEIKKMPRYIGYILIWGAILLLFVIFLTVIITLNSALNFTGFYFYNPWSLIIMVLTIIVIIFYPYLAGKITDMGDLHKNICNRLNFWVALSFGTIAIFIFIFSLLIVNVYPGTKDLGVEYPWEYNSHVKNISQIGTISGVTFINLDNSESNYFIFEDTIQVSFSIENKSYLSEKIILSLQNQSEVEVLHKEECINTSGKCKFTFNLNKDTKYIYLNLFLIPRGGNESELFSFRKFAPEILTNEQDRDIRFNTILLLGSFITLIFLSVFSGINNLRQLVQNYSK